jgi:uncharacterized protein (TIGR03437 family)
VASSGSTTTAPVVTLGGVTAQVTSANLSAQYLGMYQLNVVVPSGIPAGSSVPVQIQIGGVTSSNPATIALQ